jgi:hypothetical protein
VVADELGHDVVKSPSALAMASSPCWLGSEPGGCLKHLDRLAIL